MVKKAHKWEHWVIEASAPSPQGYRYNMSFDYITNSAERAILLFRREHPAEDVIHMVRKVSTGTNAIVIDQEYCLVEEES